MARPKYPSDKQDQFMLRMPEGMRDRIRIAAEGNGRSMNAEIVAALEEAFPAPNPIEHAMQELGAAMRRYQEGPRTKEAFDALPRFAQLLIADLEKEEREEFEAYQRDAAGEPER